ncbi:MAG: diguanylate cyclase [Streptosporangiaceae bacterium]|jgi:hypothetical protein
MAGGEVIGSVLLSRPAPYSEAGEQRIRESVSQAAPGLANLRNLAVAEIGVAGFPGRASTPERLERLADAALYVAKRQGRNRVELASAEPGSDLPGPVPPEAAVNGPGPASVPAALTDAPDGPQVRGRPAWRPWSAGRWRRPSRRRLTGRRPSGSTILTWR